MDSATSGPRQRRSKIHRASPARPRLLALAARWPAGGGEHLTSGSYQQRPDSADHQYHTGEDRVLSNYDGDGSTEPSRSRRKDTSSTRISIHYGMLFDSDGTLSPTFCAHRRCTWDAPQRAGRREFRAHQNAPWA